MKSDGELRQKYRSYLPQVAWSSIESGGSEPGIPDCCGVLDGVTFFVENKLTAGFTIEMRPAQIGWMLRHCRQGGIGFIAIRRIAAAGPRRGAATDELWLYSGAAVADLAKCGMTEIGLLGRWDGGPRAWPWAEVLGIFLKKI